MLIVAFLGVPVIYTKLMGFMLRMVDCVLKMMGYMLMDFMLKMMDFSLQVWTAAKVGDQRWSREWG